MSKATELKIEALRGTLERLRLTQRDVRNEPRRPWRDEEPDTSEQDFKEAMDDIEAQIIELEHSLIDPEQYAEMLAETQAAIMFSGSHDDPYLYMHTRTEEEAFQRQIQHDVTHGYFHPEDGWVDGCEDGPYKGSCSGCGTVVWEDDVYMLDGFDMCESCQGELGAFLMLFAIWHGYGMEEGRYGEWHLIKKTEACL